MCIAKRQVRKSATASWQYRRASDKSVHKRPWRHWRSGLGAGIGYHFPFRALRSPLKLKKILSNGEINKTTWFKLRNVATNKIHVLCRSLTRPLITSNQKSWKNIQRQKVIRRKKKKKTCFQAPHYRRRPREPESIKTTKLHEWNT